MSRAVADQVVWSATVLSFTCRRLPAGTVAGRVSSSEGRNQYLHGHRRADRRRHDQAVHRRESERGESLFEHPVRIPNTGMASVSVIGGQYIVALDHSHFLPVM